MPRVSAGRTAGRAVQGAEHGAEFVHHEGGARNGTRAGRAGGGGGRGTVRADESDPVKTHERHGLAGHRQRRGLCAAFRARLFPRQKDIDAAGHAGIQCAVRGIRRDRDRRRGQPCRDQPEECGRVCEYGYGEGGESACAAGRRHRPRRRVRAALRNSRAAGPGRARAGQGTCHQQIPRRRIDLNARIETARGLNGHPRGRRRAVCASRYRRRGFSVRAA